MKYKDCPGYNKDTEIIRNEIGSAGGEIIYNEKEIVLNERCAVQNKINNFECDNCPIYKTHLKEKENN